MTVEGWHGCDASYACQYHENASFSLQALRFVTLSHVAVIAAVVDGMDEDDAVAAAEPDDEDFEAQVRGWQWSSIRLNSQNPNAAVWLLRRRQQGRLVLCGPKAHSVLVCLDSARSSVIISHHEARPFTVGMRA